MVVNNERNSKLPQYVNPSDAVPEEDAKIIETPSISKHLSAMATQERNDLGNGIHHIISAEVINPETTDTFQFTEEILSRYGLLKVISAKDALSYMREFMTFFK